MQRNEGESFGTYKARRLASNKERDNINGQARGGKQPNPRARRAKGSFGIKGIRYTNMSAFGAAFAASRAARRVTAYLLEGHRQYLAKIEARREARAAEAEAKAAAASKVTKRRKVVGTIDHVRV
jgi:hypothetical protein